VLAEIVTNLPLPSDEPAREGCGDCHACVDACPGGALPGDGLVDCRRCVSYLTIEHRTSIAEDRYNSFGGNIFGCDACQRACPHNASVPPGEGELTRPRTLAELPLADVLALSEARWDELTRGSAMRRCRYEMLLRNAAIAAGNLRRADGRAALERLAGSGLPPAAQAAAWALPQLV
jgi:epoxyqueuosine reductase